MRSRLALIAISGMALAACVTTTDEGGAPTEATEVAGGDSGDCIRIPAAISPEKIALFEDLAEEFNDSGAEVDGNCVFVAPYRKSSGAGAQALIAGWAEDGSDGELPVVWSPAGSGWGAIVNERSGQDIASGTPFTELLDRLLELALERYREERAYRF